MGQSMVETNSLEKLSEEIPEEMKRRLRAKQWRSSDYPTLKAGKSPEEPAASSEQEAHQTCRIHSDGAGPQVLRHRSVRLRRSFLLTASLTTKMAFFGYSQAVGRRTAD